MIAVDTNILVYAHRPDLQFHTEAANVLERLATGAERWGLPWPCIHEFISTVTHRRIFPKAPTSLALALEAVQALLDCGTVEVLAEGDGYFSHLTALAQAARVEGPRIHDARIAALCRYHGVRELWSADRDFSRFAGIKVCNPLL
jgi:uncharacterized protein